MEKKIITIEIGPGLFEVYNNGKLDYTTKNFSDNIRNNILNVLEDKLASDEEISSERGLADFVDDSVQDPIDYIIFNNITVKKDGIYLIFSIGLDWDYIESDNDYNILLDYIETFVIEQMLSLWGNKFSKETLTTVHGKDFEVKYKPWVVGSSEILVS